jgi:hypothetical protein
MRRCAPVRQREMGVRPASESATNTSAAINTTNRVRRSQPLRVFGNETRPPGLPLSTASARARCDQHGDHQRCLGHAREDRFDYAPPASRSVGAGDRAAKFRWSIEAHRVGSWRRFGTGSAWIARKGPTCSKRLGTRGAAQGWRRDGAGMAQARLWQKMPGPGGPSEVAGRSDDGGQVKRAARSAGDSPALGGRENIRDT